MDDSRITQLTEEVLAQLAGSGDPVTADLEARVAALEGAVRQLQGGRAAPASATAVVVAHTHPSLQLLAVTGGSAEGRCILEPDKPCVQSGQCRTLGH